MHVDTLLHKLIGKSCKNIDKRIVRTLFQATETLSRCKKLSISGLGRCLHRVALVKHTIKCIDRLFGNKRLQKNTSIFYQAMAKILINKYSRPIIVIDWSGLTRCGAYHFLRAALPVGGRTLTIYERAYHISEYGKYKTHKEFLSGLKELLPQCCHPIIVTDAGFRNNWFRLVISHGWDFIGRIRHNTQYKEKTIWKPIKDLYRKACYQAEFIGEFLLARSNPLNCYFYMMKEKKKYRAKYNLSGKKIQCSVSLKHAKRGNEPWLIATSLNPKLFTPINVMSIYKKRMQIEEAFRDLKNTKIGFSLRHCRSFSKERLNIALLIAALAMFILWIIGITAKQKNLQYSFQPNTVRKHNVLSNFIIGWQVLEKHIHFTNPDITNALQELHLCHII